MASQGTTTINFGGKATDTSVSVSAPSITGAQLVEAWIFPATTASNTQDNHWVEELSVVAGPPVAGVGFTIYAKVSTGFGHGVYNIAWVFN
jgi:hypothetical protein